MTRTFNTAALCIAGDHELLNALQRLDVDEMLQLIDRDATIWQREVRHAGPLIGAWGA